MSSPAVITMPPKYPGEALDYTVNWADRLVPGDTIVGHSAQVVSGSAVIPGGGEGMATATHQTFWLSGGSALEEVHVLLTVTTNATPARTHEVLVRVGVLKDA